LVSSQDTLYEFFVILLFANKFLPHVTKLALVSYKFLPKSDILSVFVWRALSVFSIFYLFFFKKIVFRFSVTLILSHFPAIFEKFHLFLSDVIVFIKIIGFY